MTGMLVWVPLMITFWVCWFVISKVGYGLDFVFQRGARLASQALRPLGYDFPSEIEGGLLFGFAIAVVLFLTTGLLARYIVIQRIVNLGEQILDYIPFIRNVYRAVQQIRDVFVTREGAVFQQVCLVQYPREGCYAVAFVTSREQGIVQDKLDDELAAIFLPTTPNPTSGFLLYLPKDELKILDISVEDAMKLIISGGAYIPSKRVPAQKVDGKKLPVASVESDEINIAK